MDKNKFSQNNKIGGNKTVSINRGILRLPRPPVIDTISPPHVASISQLLHRPSSLSKGVNNLPSASSRRPPPVKLII